MVQVSSPRPNTLPGIVFDQPEIYESEPIENEDTGIADLNLNNEPADEAIALIEVPIKQAFSYFAERENEIARFYVQRHGEYKITGDKPEEETEIEKYHRLVAEVNELLENFRLKTSTRSDDDELSAIGSLNSAALTNNLEVLSKQLKSLEFAAEDNGLNQTRAELQGITAKLEKFGQKVIQSEDTVHQTEGKLETRDDPSKIIRMSALERRLNALESLIGHDESKAQNLFKITRCGSITEVTDTLNSWLSLFKPDSIQRLSKELDYLSQRVDKASETAGTKDDTLDSSSKGKLEHLCDLVTSTDKYRAMIPTIIHRLNAMEELQLKAAQVTTTLNHLEIIQAQILDNMQSNKDELASLKEMFGKNMELIKELSNDIDSRISAIRERCEG